MAGVRRLQDDERTERAEVLSIETQLDRWKVPRRHTSLGGGAGTPMTTLGRIRFMRNQAVATVAALTAERDRLQRLLDAKEKTWQSSV